VGCDVIIADGEQEFVVKLMSAEGGIQKHAPVCESVSVLLAQDLGIPTAEPCLIDITKDFAESIEDPIGRKRCLNSLGLNFATKYLGPGYRIVSPEIPLPEECLPTMADIYVFDALIQNHDRMAGDKPNALLQGRDLRIIDHEWGYGLLEIAPTDFKKPETCFLWSKHLFHRQLKGSQMSVDRLLTRFTALSEEQFENYLRCLPDTWPGKAHYSKVVIEHLRYAKEHIHHVSKYATSHFWS
jgi:hypothetical protein